MRHQGRWPQRAACILTHHCGRGFATAACVRKARLSLGRAPCGFMLPHVAGPWHVWPEEWEKPMRCLALAALLPVAAHAASVQPAAGSYAAQVQYVAVKTAGGATCPAQGSTYSGILTYAGPGKPAMLYSTENKSGQLAVVRTTLSKTPAAGGTNWNGSASVADSTPGSLPSGVTYATFTATLKLLDTNSFTASFNWFSGQATGSCTETIAMSFTRL